MAKWAALSCVPVMVLELSLKPRWTRVNDRTVLLWSNDMDHRQEAIRVLGSLLRFLMMFKIVHPDVGYAKVVLTQSEFMQMGENLSRKLYESKRENYV